MLRNSPQEPDALGRGAYSAVETLRLLNFRRPGLAASRRISRSTVARWLRGYEHGEGLARHSDPLWRPDYINENDQIELSFRDLIELRFVKAFRDLGLGLTTIRDCYRRAAEEVRDDRPFSTQKFRTDGLKRRQQVFRSFIEPSLRDLEFDASTVARWYPLGFNQKTVVVDPARLFGRPIVQSGVPTEVLAEATKVEGSVAAVVSLYGVSKSDIRGALEFERRLAA